MFFNFNRIRLGTTYSVVLIYDNIIWIRTMETGRLYKLAAFTNSPAGGNPAGVWIGETFPNAGIMQSIAAEVGFRACIFYEEFK